MLCGLAACGASSQAPAAPAASSAPWPVPAGFRSETIPFPLEFAPAIAQRGAEELRFAPGFFDPAAPGYWSYAFVWRTADPAALEGDALGAALTLYFRGLIDAVDGKHQIDHKETITAAAVRSGARMRLAVHVIDAFKTQQPVDLVGWADHLVCGDGGLWRFVLAPSGSAVRPALDALAGQAACGQPVPPPPRH